MIDPSSSLSRSSPINLDTPVKDTTDQNNAVRLGKGQADAKLEEAAQEAQNEYSFDIAPRSSPLSRNENEIRSKIYALIISLIDLLQEYGVAQTVLIQGQTERVKAENEKLAQIVMPTKGSPGRLGDDTDEAKAERNDFMQFLSTLRENLQIKKGEIEDSIKLSQSYATNTQNVTNSLTEFAASWNTVDQALLRLINAIKGT